MPLRLEREVEAYLKTKVEGLGGKYIKIPATYEEGIPDRLVVMPGGKIAFVELKRPIGGRLAPMQKYQIAKLKKLGCLVRVVKNYVEADELIKEMIEDDSR